jgi:hypothetical protein
MRNTALETEVCHQTSKNLIAVCNGRGWIYCSCTVLVTLSGLQWASPYVCMCNRTEETNFFFLNIIYRPSRIDPFLG